MTKCLMFKSEYECDSHEFRSVHLSSSIWALSRHHFQLHVRRWARVRQAVLNRDGWRCRECGRAGRLEVDHVVPLDKGGDPWAESNLQCLCRACHIEKTRTENRRERTAAEREWDAMVAELADENNVT